MPKQLNSAGIGHHALIALLLISTVAGFGAWRVWSSSAATLTGSLATYQKRVATSDGCWLAGRVWDSAKNDCLPKCRANTGVYKTIKGTDGGTRGFCTDAVAESLNTVAEAKRCVETLKRVYILEIGCARRAAQDNANNARQCIGYNSADPKAFKNYVAEGGVDRCVAPALAQTGNNTPSGNNAGTVASDKIDKATCLALGRVYDATKNVCNQQCAADTGVLFVHANKTRYCSKAVGTGIGEQRCGELHRRWTPAGCARRADQKDNAKDTLSCLVGYPYYNSNSEASSNGKLDVCEKNKAESDKNEQSGIVGGVQVSQPEQSDGGDAQNPPPGTDTSEFKIILFKDKDFKGDQLVVTESTAHLSKSWDNKVSSYKILKGRWQLCPEPEFKASKATNCIRPWASDPNLSDVNNKQRKLDNQITSVRPVVKEIFSEIPSDVAPTCADASGMPVPPTADGTCPDNSALGCPSPLELKDGECKEKVLDPQLIVPVDKSFKGKTGQEKCELLGREWIGKPSGKKEINGGEYGCSLRTCERERDGAPRQAENGPVCVNYEHDVAYAATMSEKQCKDLHRVYIDQVKRCAQVPNRKDKNHTVVNARQCGDKGHSVYYIFKENGKNDECFRPKYFDNAKRVAKNVRGSLSAALKQGPRAYCNTAKRGNYHWDGKKCVIDRHKCWNGQSIPVTKRCPPAPQPDGEGGNGGQGAGNSSAPSGESWAAFCARLGRASAGSGCASSCTSGSEARNPQHLSYGWDYCDPKGEVCRSHGTGGTKSCYGDHQTPDNQEPEGKTYYRTYAQAAAEGLRMSQYGYKPDSCNPGTYGYNIGLRLHKPFRIAHYFGTANTLVITDGVCK